MEFSEEEQLTLFHALAKADGIDNRFLWDRGANFCLQYDKEHPENKARLMSELRKYLRNTVDSKRSRSLDIKPIDRWAKLGIEEGALIAQDMPELHAKAILSKILSPEDRNQILAEKESREEILQQLQEGRYEQDFKDKITQEIELAARKEILKRDKQDNPHRKLKDVKAKLHKAAQERGVAPSKELSSQVKDAELLKEIRKIAKEKNPDQLAHRAQEYQKIKNMIGNHKQND